MGTHDSKVGMNRDSLGNPECRSVGPRSWLRRGRLVLALLALALGARSGTAAESLWINELHYDNAGTDAGEFVEVAVPTGFADLANLSVSLYNGGDGKPYGSSHPLSGFNVGESVGETTLYWKLIGGLQNGPDGVSLDLGGASRDFVSYEGAFTATEGPAAGLLSFNLGAGEDGTAAAGGSVGLSGVGSVRSDFGWTVFAESSPGFVNLGQSITSVPEPRPTVLLATLGLGLGLIVWGRARLGR